MNEQHIRRTMRRDGATYDEIEDAVSNWASDEHDRRKDQDIEELRGRNWPFPKLRDKTMKPTQQEINDYLLMLRDSGITNMWGAGPYLEERFGLTRYEAKDALLAWIKGFKNENQ